MIDKNLPRDEYRKQRDKIVGDMIIKTLEENRDKTPEERKEIMIELAKQFPPEDDITIKLKEEQARKRRERIEEDQKRIAERMKNKPKLTDEEYQVLRQETEEFKIFLEENKHLTDDELDEKIIALAFSEANKKKGL